MLLVAAFAATQRVRNESFLTLREPERKAMVSGSQMLLVAAFAATLTL
jgi:hypothetical protein